MSFCGWSFALAAFAGTAFISWTESAVLSITVTRVRGRLAYALAQDLFACHRLYLVSARHYCVVLVGVQPPRGGRRRRVRLGGALRVPVPRMGVR